MATYLHLWGCWLLLGLQHGSSDTTERPNYDELNEKIEQISKWMHLALVKISFPLKVLGPLFITLVNYFVKGMGDDSYQDDTMM